MLFELVLNQNSFSLEFIETIINRIETAIAKYFRKFKNPFN